MNSQGTLFDVTELLKAIDGVTVLESFKARGLVRFELAIDSHQAHLILRHASEGANIPLHSWVKNPPGSSEASISPARAIGYRLTFQPESNADDDIDDLLKWFGAHVTWALYAANRITAQQETQLATIFGAVSRSSREAV